MRQITNNDYFTNDQGELCLKSEIALTTYWDFAEKFEEIANGYHDAPTGNLWHCQIIEGDTFLGWGSVPLVAIPEGKAYHYYAVQAGPVAKRKVDNALANDYTETFTHIVKVKFEDGVISNDNYPKASAYAEGPGGIDRCDPVALSYNALETLGRVHSLYLKMLPLHAKIKAEGMI